jgi:signal transduction histidine kinase
VNLRTRLALTAVAVAAPVIATMVWLDARARHAAAEHALSAVVSGYMQRPGERERCERDPGHWGGRPLLPPAPHGPPNGPEMRPEPPPPRFGRRRAPPHPPHLPGDHPGGAPPVLFAYDEHMKSHHPRAPQLAAAPQTSWWPGSAVQTLVATSWREGPCAYVLARGTTNPYWFGGLLPQTPLWLVPLALVLLALLLSVGPVVRRIRRLTKAVRESAAAGFSIAVPVEGGDEVAQLARAFAAASAEVQRQLAERDRREQALREFVANTTHDLMIPLTVLKSHLATLSEQGAQPDVDALKGAVNEAHYIGALTQNLGIAAKLDAGEPQIVRARVDLSALVERVLARHRPIARQLGVALEGAVPELPLESSGDVTLIEQAVNNIIYNAIRYNTSGGHVGVSLDRLAERFRLRVVDDGPGIAPEQLAQLVERGFRNDAARTRAPEGQGLGLNIAQRVCQLLELELQLAPSEYGGLQVDICGRAL